MPRDIIEFLHCSVVKTCIEINIFGGNWLMCIKHRLNKLITDVGYDKE